jgi:membrane protein DedA with SNARE-associated domain
VLLEQLGAPVPALPVLLLAGAKGIGDSFYLGYALVLAIVASALGDLAWFWAGRRYGHRVLRLLCRLTLSPDSCVRQTESAYERRGAAAAIVIAKFIPGLATVAPPLAGALRLGVWRFLLFDCAGAALYYGAGLALGLIFHAQIHWLVEQIEGIRRVRGACRDRRARAVCRVPLVGPPSLRRIAARRPDRGR